MTEAVRDPELQRLLDEAEIGRVIHRYVRGIDRGDPELVRSCYHPDGIDHHAGFSGTRDEFVEWVIDDTSGYTFVSHHLTNMLIEVIGDQALVETYSLTANGADPGIGTRKSFVGGFRYIDRFERRDGRWLIAERHVVSDWMEGWAPHRERLERNGGVGRFGPDDLLYDVGRTIAGWVGHSKA